MAHNAGMSAVIFPAVLVAVLVGIFVWVRLRRPQPGPEWAAYTRARDAAYMRQPLTTGQHVLHLILTVLTGGLWGIVWAVRAHQGNTVPRPGVTPPARPRISR